jgi:hypothetical protein
MELIGSELRDVQELSVVDEDDNTALVVVLTSADLAECNCPEFCERDHELD